jgi:hypothetical protein
MFRARQKPSFLSNPKKNLVHPSSKESGMAWSYGLAWDTRLALRLLALRLLALRLLALRLLALRLLALRLLAWDT